MAKILVIDDSDVIRDLLTEFLVDEGFEVDSTEDSSTGVQLALSNDYALCICDMHLPDRYGSDIYKEVSAQRPELPFLITDSLPEGLSRQVRKPGNYGYLRKPFDLDQLRVTLNQIIETAKTV